MSIGIFIRRGWSPDPLEIIYGTLCSACEIFVNVKILSLSKTPKYLMKIFQRSAAIAAIISIFFTLHAESATRRSKYVGEDLQRRLSRHEGVSISLRSDTIVYFQGQEIDLYYQISCVEPRICPWNSFEVAFRFELEHNGERVDRSIHGMLPEGVGDLKTEFSGISMNLCSYFNVQQARAQDGFSYLLPGNYVGYFDDGVVSPDVRFTVLPVPDTLQYY